MMSSTYFFLDADKIRPQMLFQNPNPVSCFGLWLNIRKANELESGR